MAQTGRSWDAIVVGGGHNGLVAAAYLAKGGLSTLVLERRERVGGIADTHELKPGVRVPAVAHTVGRLRPSVVRDLALRSHGLHLIAPEVRVFAPAPDGSAITLYDDIQRTADGLRARSGQDAASYAGFDRLVRSLGRFLAELGGAAPPDINAPSFGDALTGLKLTRSFRGLGKHDGRSILRVLPMAIADFVAESFETDALRGILAARGIQNTAMGPWSAGTTAVFLADSAGNDGGAAGQTVYARGGPGALSAALAAAVRAAGGEIRTDADVVKVTSRDGRATGVVLGSGEEITARVVVAGIDPKKVLTRLVDPVVVGPGLRWRAANIRTPGTVAKVNLALSGLPVFPAAGAGPDGERLLRGRIVIAPGIDYVERAFDASKYGGISAAPYLEATIPSLVDPTLVDDPKSGARRPARHVMSIHLQYAPYHLAEGTWPARRDELGDLAIQTLEQYAPGIGKLVVARQVLTPLDLERDYGLTGGHPYHAEPSLDSFFLWRPLLGSARYRLPVEGLYLAGSGAHPGGGVTGIPGQNAAREILSDWKKRRR
ncbi:MAG TPA: NAD(P)/FAD-dependent oxidoreductase [Candidatus Limnocylindrales bacterium]|jgi:phytoene dehydrogenase-like protein